MQPKFIPFNAQVDRLVVDATKRSEILAAAIGRAVANVQHLPTSPVDSPANFFNTQVAPQITNMVSCWNENLVFNTKTCLDYTRAFWLLRYQAAHPTARPLYEGPYGFFDTIVGVSVYFSANQHSFLNENKDVILALSMAASFMINDMQEVSNG